MYVLYEDSGNFKAEKIFSQSDSTMQVESESGKRTKIKNASVLFSFEQPAPAVLLQEADAMAKTLDIDFLWECAPQEEFEAATFAKEYFGHPPSPVEKAALIFALNGAPAYFHRRGKGAYRPAPPDILAAALAAIEKKQKQAALQQEWTDSLVAGVLPQPIAEVAHSLLTRPDKNSMQWKAFEAAVAKSGTSPEKLLLSVGAWPHALALHQHRFLSTHFPKGTAFAPVDPGNAGADLPIADVVAYSVDDNSTTEVDDALSVSPLEGDLVRIGIHIAAPGMTVTRGSDFDALAELIDASRHFDSPADIGFLISAATTPDGQQLSGWWRRVLAQVLDSLILLPVTSLLIALGRGYSGGLLKVFLPAKPWDHGTRDPGCTHWDGLAAIAASTAADSATPAPIPVPSRQTRIACCSRTRISVVVHPRPSTRE